MVHGTLVGLLPRREDDPRQPLQPRIVYPCDCPPALVPRVQTLQLHQADGRVARVQAGGEPDHVMGIFAGPSAIAELGNRIRQVLVVRGPFGIGKPSDRILLQAISIFTLRMIRGGCCGIRTLTQIGLGGID